MVGHKPSRGKPYVAAAMLALTAPPVAMAQVLAGATPAPPKLSINMLDAIPATQADTAAATQPDLSALSLEELMNIEVTSVARQKQRLGDAPAAVYVITQDDIKRSGMINIPDLLRMAPGLDVGQVEPAVWMVGSRGLNQVRSNNLLVLMDGRTVYTPLFSGVYWDMVDYVLQDLDRIEVIRGPGGTLWGSNAVNGVININTKSAKDTQGLLVDNYSGTDGYIGAARYGGHVDNQLFYRVYAKYRTMDDMHDPANPLINDGLDSQRYGFRTDTDLSEADKLTVQGDVFFNRSGRTLNVSSLTPVSVTEQSVISNTTGGNFLLRYTHVFSEASDLSLQVYYDNFSLLEHSDEFHQHTYDFEFQHRFPLFNAHEIIWGGGYRMIADSIEAPPTATADGNFASPASRYNSLVSGFIQDDITLVPKRLHAIVGTKLEMTPYTGFEFQPSGRLAFTPDERNTLWAGISRAVRAPSRWETDSHVLESAMPTVPLPTSIDFVGNPNLKSEQLLALEAGYRTEPVKNLSLDLAGFYNFHHGVEAIAPSGAPSVAFAPVPHVIVPISAQNEANGHSYGLELASKWKATDQLQVQGSYSFLTVDMKPTIPDNGAAQGLDHSAPGQQAQIHVYYDLTRDLQINAAAYYVGGADTPKIPGYVRADLNVSWRPEKHLELTAGVRNMFDSRRPEFQDFGVRSTTNEVPRTFFLELQARF